MDAVKGAVQAAKMKEDVETRDLQQEDEHPIDLLNQCTTEMTNEFAHCEPQLTEAQFLKVTSNDFRSWTDFHITTGNERGSQEHSAVLRCMYTVRDRMQEAQAKNAVEDYNWYSTQSAQGADAGRSDVSAAPGLGGDRDQEELNANDEIRLEPASDTVDASDTRRERGRSKRRQVNELVTIQALNRLTETGDITMFKQFKASGKHAAPQDFPTRAQICKHRKRQKT